MKINCIILDDQQVPRMVMEKFVKKTDSLNLVKSCSMPEEAIEIIEKEKIDLIFLDISMPEMNGLELMKSLYDPPHAIVVTNYEEYGVAACNIDRVLHYLLKPVEYAPFLEALNVAKEKIEYEDNFIFERVRKEDEKLVTARINKQDIRWMEVQRNHVQIKLPDTTYKVRKTMQEMLKKLSPRDFLRVHRSFLVRIDQIDHIDGNAIIIDGEFIPIGRDYKEEVKRRLNVW